MSKELYVPQVDVRSSSSENERVREVYLREKVRLLGEDHPMGHKCKACGDFRGDLARDWVDLAQRVNLRVPGAEAREPLRRGETERERRVDAARTRIRHLEAAEVVRDWALTGIEATIADRNGMALPGAAYQTQGRLNV